MQKIHKSSFSVELGLTTCEQEKVGTKEEFLSINVEDILIHHHKSNADITYFYLSDEKESNKVLFLISQDNDLTKELNMSPPNREKTLDLLENSQQNEFSSISLKKLQKDLVGNQGDYEMEIDGRGYSFRLVQGIKVRNILEKLNEFQEEVENIKEYETGSSVKIKM